MAKGDQAKMKERYDYYVSFGDFTAKFINEAVENGAIAVVKKSSSRAVCFIGFYMLYSFVGIYSRTI